MSDNPSYYAILTADVRYDKNLSPNQKLLYAEITALSNKFGYCHASNNYFAELYGVHKNTVSGWVSALEKSGYVAVQVIKGDDGAVIQRRIYLAGISENTDTIREKIDTPIREKIDTPIREKTKYNNTSLNTINNNSNINAAKQKKTRLIDSIKSDYSTFYLVDNQVLEDWLDMRKQKKASNSKTALTRIDDTLNQLLRFHNISPTDALALQIERNWQGLKVDWVLNALSTQNNNKNEVSRTSHIGTGWFEELQRDIESGELI